MDIHHYDKRHCRALELLDAAQLSSRNKDLIRSFHDALVLENISKPRLLKYLEILRKVADLLEKDLDGAKEEDLKRVVAHIQQRTDYSVWTKQAYKIIIRRFYKWLCGTKDYPELVNWIRINIPRSQMKLPSEGELLTPTEARRLIDAAGHPRDKALLSVLWESGARISEIGNLSLRNVQFDRYGTVISVRGKTGSRKIRLVTSTPYLSTWINCHPERNNPEAALWVNIGNTNRGKKMDYAAIRKMLQTVAEVVGLKKRVNPHSFRHSRATYMANSLTEFQMNQYFGWIQGSNMPAVYVHMSGREVDKAVLAMHGITQKEEVQSEETASICPRCETINDVGFDFCLKCGAVLNEKKAATMEEERQKEQNLRNVSDELMNHLLRDEEVQRLIRRKVGEMGSGVSGP